MTTTTTKPTELELSYTLLPGEGPIQLVAEDGRMYKFPNSDEVSDLIDNIGQRRHIYITSNLEVKLKNWVITCDGRLGKVMDLREPLFYVLIGDMKYAFDRKECQLVETSSDPVVIKDGVPALPEVGYYKIGHPGIVQAGFLAEFRERWNEKNKAVDVEKVAFDEYIKLQGTSSEYNRMYGHHYRTFIAGRKSVLLGDQRENTLLADIRNKLSPFKNLVAMLESSDLVYHSDIHKIIEREIGQCKKNIEYLQSLQEKPAPVKPKVEMYCEIKIQAFDSSHKKIQYAFGDGDYTISTPKLSEIHFR
jgi:hypothetical protein